MKDFQQGVPQRAASGARVNADDGDGRGDLAVAEKRKASE